MGKDIYSADGTHLEEVGWSVLSLMTVKLAQSVEQTRHPQQKVHVKVETGVKAFPT